MFRRLNEGTVWIKKFKRRVWIRNGGLFEGLRGGQRFWIWFIDGGGRLRK